MLHQYLINRLAGGSTKLVLCLDPDLKTFFLCEISSGKILVIPQPSEVISYERELDARGKAANHGNGRTVEH